MAKPKLLLLDGPSMGSSPIMVDAVFGIIVDTKKKNMTILMPKRNAGVALDYSDY